MLYFNLILLILVCTYFTRSPRHTPSPNRDRTPVASATWRSRDLECLSMPRVSCKSSSTPCWTWRCSQSSLSQYTCCGSLVSARAMLGKNCELGIFILLLLHCCCCKISFRFNKTRSGLIHNGVIHLSCAPNRAGWCPYKSLLI